ncbi:MAG: amino acid ABC transporter ATP-binding protein [Spirochaetaceae bacterium]|jgi:L-cystine transport system ATP-binding protein|nr:amino acid ABC transporter ATP-binding protein [Spirochaetaceae bacterium]
MPKSLPLPSDTLRVENLKKSFHKNQVLKGINLTVRPGESVGVIGPSGSGKSTLLRCINLLEKPDEGRLSYHGLSLDMARVRKKDLLAVRRFTAMVFQQFNLFKYKTALENVMEGLVVVQKLGKRDARDRAAACLTQVGLADRVDYYPSQLSGGQQQRVAIARSIALKPGIILFDEPTSALDPEMTGEVLRVIKEIADGGHTLIIVSHEMAFIADIANRVIFLDGGKILEEGTPKEIFAHPKEDRTKQFISKITAFGDFSI